jgi:hypothetical protein
MKSYLIIIFLIFASALSAQEKKEKKKFVPDKWLHIKLGTTINLYNAELYKSLNESNTINPSFVSAKNTAINPMGEISFESQFSKYIGINIGFGFMQTRHNYNFDYTKTSSYSSPTQYSQTGLILCNIPNLNIQPTFYLKNTRIMVGAGLYKYYYYFNPISIAGGAFNLNAEGITIYSKISIMQLIHLKSNDMTITGSYFGIQKKFDNGFQLTLGLAL